MSRQELDDGSEQRVLIRREKRVEIMRSCGDGTTVASGRSRIHMAFTLSAWHPIRCILQPSPVHCNTYIRMYIHLAALYVLTTTVTPLHWTPIFICVCVYVKSSSVGFPGVTKIRYIIVLTQQHYYVIIIICTLCASVPMYTRGVFYGRVSVDYQNIIHRRTWIIFENYEYLKQKQCPMKCISIDNSGFF